MAALVRQHDRDRYLTALFAPAGAREALFALYAFNYEIARVRESVSQPMLGQIRLQWWREVIEAAYAGAAPRRHEVALPLTETIRRYGLTRGLFERLIDAREHDLDPTPPANFAALEEYAEASSASLVLLALEVLDRDCLARPGVNMAAVAVGVGYALAGLLRAMPFHVRSGLSYIPENLAAESGLDPNDYTRLRASPALIRAADCIAAGAEKHLGDARRLAPEIPRPIFPALLPAIVARGALRRLRRAGGNPFAPALARPDPLLAWRLSAAMLLRRL